MSYSRSDSGIAASQQHSIVWHTNPVLLHQTNRESMNNPYEVLGVAADASQEDIRKAYRKAAKETAP